MFRVKTSSKTLKALLKALGEIDSEPMMVFRRDKVVAWGMDPSHTMMVSMEIKPEFFSAYEFGALKPIKVCIDAIGLSKWLPGKDYDAEIRHDGKEIRAIVFSSSSKISKKVSIYEERTPPPPIDIELIGSARVPSADLAEGYAMVFKGTKDVVLEVEEAKFKVIGRENGTVCELEVGDEAISYPEEGKLRGIYNGEYMKMIIDAAKSLADSAEFKFTKQGILEVDIAASGFTAKYFLAPILEEAPE